MQQIEDRTPSHFGLWLNLPLPTALKAVLHLLYQAILARRMLSQTLPNYGLENLDDSLRTLKLYTIKPRAHGD